MTDDSSSMSDLLVHSLQEDHPDFFPQSPSMNLVIDGDLLLATPSPTKGNLLSENEFLLKKYKTLLEQNFQARFSILKYIDKPGKIKFYTGLQSYRSFYALYQLFYPECLDMNYLGGQRAETKTVSEQKCADRRGRPRSIILMDELFMTLVRLRRNMEIEELGEKFGIDSSSASRIINTWLMLMADRFSQIDIWPKSPSPEMLLVPKKLKPRFKDVHVIVDATEVFSQRPSAVEAQKELFSSYKHRVTFKTLVGMDLNGVLTFTSRVYAGRTSDKKLLAHCGLLEKVKPGCSVMADRGFDMKDVFESLGINLFIPSFLQKNAQFSAEDLKQSREVANVRTHVERVIGRVKEFKIVRFVLPITLAPMADKIWLVCCMLSNFTGRL
jgi:DDE superfamily endonuclease/Helix-turn-helix of DDE superfamily endonuclease